MSEILGSLFKYMMAALAISAVVAVLYNVLFNDKVSKAVTDTTLLQTNIQAAYNGQANFTSLTTARAASGALAPSEMITGSTLVNPWGGAVTVNVNAGNASRFDVTHAGVPADACPKLATSQSGLVNASINGAVQTLPVDAGTAISACNAGANNTVSFTYAH
jgi:hypothetical protein